MKPMRTGDRIVVIICLAVYLVCLCRIAEELS